MTGRGKPTSDTETAVSLTGVWVPRSRLRSSVQGVDLPEGLLLVNLAPVTLGNLIGGTVLVGAVYWFVYLRPRARGPRAPLG